MDNVKILLVCGSPRPKARSATYAGLQAVMEGAQRGDGVEVELVELFGRKIAPCIPLQQVPAGRFRPLHGVP